METERPPFWAIATVIGGMVLALYLVLILMIFILDWIL